MWPRCRRGAVDKPVIDFQVPWNAPEAYVTLDSTRAYDLNTTFVPDVLGLRARRSEAAVVKVMTGRDSRSVRVLVLDEKMKDRGFHDVTLLDMGDVEGPDVSVGDLSILRLQWPLSVLYDNSWS